MDQLRLMALDADDLGVVSATCQDAVTRVSDLVLLPREKRFVATLNRFVWEKAPPRRKLFGPRPQYERRRSVLHFDRVLSARRTGFDALREEEVMSLLAIRWTATGEPSGTVDLVFAADAAIRLEVECIEAQLTDLGAAWSTASRPDHDRA